MDEIPEKKPPKPKLRGVFHLIGALIALIASPFLYLHASEETKTIGIVIYAVCLVLLLAVSALYHTPMWRPQVRARLRRVDHSMIYIFVAGTYTPILMELGERVSPWMMPAVWSAAGVGIILALFFGHAPRYIRIAPYIVMSWGGAVILPELYMHLGQYPFWLLLGGGLAYSLGAIVYARRLPNPAPRVFGYHEVFHLLVLVAAACHYVAIWDIAT